MVLIKRVLREAAGRQAVSTTFVLHNLNPVSHSASRDRNQRYGSWRGKLKILMSKKEQEDCNKNCFVVQSWFSSFLVKVHYECSVILFVDKEDYSAPSKKKAKTKTKKPNKQKNPHINGGCLTHDVLLHCCLFDVSNFYRTGFSLPDLFPRHHYCSNEHIHLLRIPDTSVPWPTRLWLELFLYFCVYLSYCLNLP